MCLGRIPLYYEAKLIFILWLVSSYTKGALLIYNKYESSIDHVVKLVEDKLKSIQAVSSPCCLSAGVLRNVCSNLSRMSRRSRSPKLPMRNKINRKAFDYPEEDMLILACSGWFVDWRLFLCRFGIRTAVQTNLIQEKLNEFYMLRSSLTLY